MNTKITARRAGLLASATLTLIALASHAQDTLGEEDLQESSHISEFRTFEPVESELQIFAAPGAITHEGGEAVYNAVCSGCHMPAGEGAEGAGIYPALADNELLAAPSYPIYLILEGQRAMPPFGGILDDQQVADVVNYIRSNFGNDFVEEWGEATAEEVAQTRQ
ncbi:c-type cytochrome [Yoonia sp.]|uniref:c-type cytochrome n=1 Tax=Yoonia sp. TaxID=2212373 RepID=UPI00391AA667